MAAFEHVNLKDVNPDDALIPAGPYNLKLTKVELKSYESKKEPGTKGEYISLSVGIADHPDYLGRRVFASMFPGNGTNKQLRRLMDATGIEPDGAFEKFADVATYLDNIRVSGAVFSAPVTEVTEVINGASKPVNRLNMWDVAVAQ